MNAQTVCAYESEGQMYIITYGRSFSAELNPNPSDGRMVLTIGNFDKNDALTITIYDAFRKISFAVLGEETPLDCSALPKGMYHYRIMARGDQVATGKFVMQ